MDWISGISVFIGAVALGWFTTQGVDWLLQVPMVPSDEPDSLRPNVQDIEVLEKLIEQLVNEGNAGQPSYLSRSFDQIALAWSKIVIPMETAESIAAQIAEKEAAELPADRRGFAMSLLSQARVPLVILADGGAPAQPFDQNRTMAHWKAATDYLSGSVIPNLESFVKQLPEYNTLRQRVVDLLRELKKIESVARQLVYGG